MPIWLWILIILGSILIAGLLIFFFVKWQQATSRAERAENAEHMCQETVGRAVKGALEKKTI